MGNSQKTISQVPIIDPTKWGVSFSIKQCRDLNVDPDDTLSWMLANGWRRFRLMSYWNEHEKQKGTYDFSALDSQIHQIQKAGGEVSLCLGARQPRWPENHWPQWAWDAPNDERTEALIEYVRTVVSRYKDYECVTSWQLENEALLKSFGERSEIDRRRLRTEYATVKQVDSDRPCIMTTSTSWGIPLHRPIPDAVGFSFYQSVFSKNTYKITKRLVLVDKIRAFFIKLFWGKATFIHELQCEPWGPKAIWEMSLEEQDKSMGSEQIKSNLSTCQKSGLFPMYLWGGEWWYWRMLQGDNATWQVVRGCISPENIKL